MAFWDDVLALQVGEWLQFPVLTGSKISDVYASPNPGGSQISICEAYGGAAFDSLRKDIYYTGGGHNAYSGNEIYALSVDPLSANLGKFRIKGFCSTRSDGATVEEYADGAPSGFHAYVAWIYDAARDRVYRMAGVAPWGTSGSYTVRTYELDPDFESPATAIGAQWTRRVDTASGDADAGFQVDPNTGRVYGWFSGGSSESGLRYWNPVANTWTTVTTFADIPATKNVGVAINGTGNRLVAVGNGAGNTWACNITSGAYVGVGSASRLGATGDTAIETAGGPGLCWDSTSGLFVGWYGLLTGGTDRRDYYTLDLDTAVWTRHTGTGDIPPVPETLGIRSRLTAIGDGLVVLVNKTTEEAYMLRVAGGEASNPAVPSGLGVGQRLKGIRR